MTKPKGKPGRHLSNEDREEIRELHRQGASALKIARLLGIAFNTASKWSRAECIPAKAVFPKDEVLALLKQRVSQKKISRTLKIPFRKVQAFARANAFRRPHFHPTQDQTVRIIEMALSHKFSCAEISRIIRGPYDRVRKVVKVVLRCEKLVSGGQEKYGLDSYFPSRYRSPLAKAEPQQLLTVQEREEAALFVVDLVRRAVGTAVADEQLVEVATLTVAAIYARGIPAAKLGATEWDKIRNYFQPHFQQAIGMLRAAEVGWTH